MMEISPNGRLVLPYRLFFFFFIAFVVLRTHAFLSSPRPSFSLFQRLNDLGSTWWQHEEDTHNETVTQRCKVSEKQQDD